MKFSPDDGLYKKHLLSQMRDVLVGEIIKRFILINRLVYFDPQ